MIEHGTVLASTPGKILTQVKKRFIFYPHVDRSWIAFVPTIVALIPLE